MNFGLKCPKPAGKVVEAAGVEPAGGGGGN